MGNQDNWHTPKQLKIERAGEPKNIKRGKLKTGQRRKGKKARMDEVLSAKKDAERYRQYINDDAQRRMEHPEWYTPEPEARLRRYDPDYRKWFAKSQLKLKELIEKAVEDGVMKGEESEYYWVELHPF